MTPSRFFQLKPFRFYIRMNLPWFENANEKRFYENQRTFYTKLFKDPSSMPFQMITNDIYYLESLDKTMLQKN